MHAAGSEGRAGQGPHHSLRSIRTKASWWPAAVARSAAVSPKSFSRLKVLPARSSNSTQPICPAAHLHTHRSLVRGGQVPRRPRHAPVGQYGANGTLTRGGEQSTPPHPARRARPRRPQRRAHGCHITRDHQISTQCHTHCLATRGSTCTPRCWSPQPPSALCDRLRCTRWPPRAAESRVTCCQMQRRKSPSAPQ
jgi:hypothetical protein